MQEYHNRIRELREEKHITQVRLSTELGVAQETISAYEQGRHLPSVSSLMKLSSGYVAVSKNEFAIPPRTAAI
jgi:Predicted transcriptional regulators